MAALNTLLFLLAALAIPGLINRTRALLAGRKGIRFAQHLYDVRLLLRKGAVYSPTTTAVFRAAPSVTLGTALVAALFVPVGDLPSALGLTMKSVRKNIGTLALLSGYTSFDAIFSGDAVNGMQLVVVLLLAAYVLVKIVFTEAGRVPVDDPRTHLELTMIHEAMCLDYGGIDLAFIQIAGWLKGAALAVLAADTLLLGGALHWWWAAPLAVLLPGLAVGVVESTQARNKLSRNATFLLTIAALAALIFFVALLLHLNIDIR